MHNSLNNMEIQSFLVCDDIRTEIGNKRTLVGVYEDQINFKVTPDQKGIWPKSMKLCFFAKVKFEANELKFFNFKIRLGEEETALLSGAEIPSFKTTRSLTIAYANNNLCLAGPGEMQFYFDFLNAKKEVIETISPNVKLTINEFVPT